MKLKKVAAIFAACVMGMSMVACGGNDTGSTDSGETTETTENTDSAESSDDSAAAETTEEPTEEAAAEDLRIHQCGGCNRISQRGIYGRISGCGYYI